MSYTKQMASRNETDLSYSNLLKDVKCTVIFHLYAMPQM